MKLTVPTKLKKSLYFTGFLMLASLTLTTFFNTGSAHAATIEVNSKADTVGDDGECTLREAIDAANNNAISGAAANECVAGDASPTTDTIEFNITGTADFTRQGQDGYTITLQSGLSALGETVIVDGYSQPNALYSPDPNQTRILIEIDGAATTATSGFFVDSPNSTVRGLSVYNFEYSCISTSDLADSATIEGNYIGISGDNQTVFGSAGNGIQLGQSGGSENSIIVNNLISGLSGNGVDIEGVSNSSIENNVISDGASGGISFDFNSISDEVEVVGNIVSNNSNGGIFVSTGGSPAVINVYSNTVFNNGAGGIGVFNASGVHIGAPGLGNTVYGHSQANIGVTSLTGFFGSVSNVTVQSNSVGLPGSNTSGMGVAVQGDASDILIGGDAPSEANIISRVELAGVAVSTFTADALGVSLAPSSVSVLGNSITGTTESLGLVPDFRSGLGIDQLSQIDTDQTPDGTPNVLSGEGPTINDPLDPDAGPNNQINFPVLNSVAESSNGTQATINYSLDAAGSPTNQYQVEFFGNAEADPSGYGEGQTFLGAITSSNGDNQQTTLTLPSGYSLAGKSISATTTAIDSTTPSGFGSTSEFSRVVQVPTGSGSLASTGDDHSVYLFSVLVVLISGALLTAFKLTHTKKVYKI